MNLQIRHPRAHALAKTIAERRHVSMTEAVIQALEAEAKRISASEPLAASAAQFAAELAALKRTGGRAMTKDEIDEMWGHG